MKYPLAVHSIVIGGVLDCITTVVGVGILGHHEMNMIMLYAAAFYGWFAVFVIGKLLLHLSLGYWLLDVLRKHPDWFFYRAFMTFIMPFAVMLNTLVIIGGLVA